jgi:hypothetical protein
VILTSNFENPDPQELYVQNPQINMHISLLLFIICRTVDKFDDKYSTSCKCNGDRLRGQHWIISVSLNSVVMVGVN